MNPVEKPRLGADATERIYRFVERRGAVDPADVHEEVDLDLRRVREEIESLEREGYLVREDGRLRIAIEAGGAETYHVDGIEYTVRPARQEDFEGIVKVIRHVVGEGSYVVAETVAEQLLYEDAVVRHNYARSRLFFVATVDGAVVGWTHLDTSPVEKLSHTAQQTIGVLEPFRGYGVGGRLMERGASWAVEVDVAKLYNSLPATNDAAIEFLESHDAEVEAVRRDHYRIDGEYVDEVMLAVEPRDVVDGVSESSAEGSQPARAGLDAPASEVAWANAVAEMGRALEAADAESMRFHVRQGLQFVALGLDADG